MKALVKTKKAPEHMQIADVPEPTPDAHEAKVEVKYCGICGTDIKIRHDKHAYYGPPLVLGHEYSGVVTEVGSEVSSVSVGDEVVVAPPPTTPASPRGRSRNPWGHGGAGFESEWGFTRYGAFARYFVCDARRVLKLPDQVDLESAALTEPVSVCIRGVQDKAQVLSSDVVVVSGPGTIGLLTAQLLKAQGSFVVLLGVSSDAHRLELAKELGVDRVINVDACDPLPEILSLTHDVGADQVFECAGAEASVRTCIDLARRGGHYVQVGTSAHEMTVDFMQIAYKELTVAGSFASSRTGWERSLDLMNRELIQTAPLVSHKLPLSDWEQAFDLAERKDGVKVLLYPD